MSLLMNHKSLTSSHSQKAMGFKGLILPALIGAVLCPVLAPAQASAADRDHDRHDRDYNHRDNDWRNHDRDHHRDDDDVDFRFRINIGGGPFVYRQRQVIYAPPPPPRHVVVYTPPPHVVYCPSAPRETVIVHTNPVVIDRPVIVHRDVPVIVQDRPVVTYFGMDNDAWRDLNSGDYREARQHFANLIDVNPGEAVPQIGFAISNSLIGHDYESPKAMRKAVLMNVNALYAVGHNHPELNNEVGQMIGHYETLSNIDSRNIDNYFMIAAGHSMMGEWEAAHDSIADAINHGDRSDSTQVLRSFIDSQLDYR